VKNPETQNRANQQAAPLRHWLLNGVALSVLSVALASVPMTARAQDQRPIDLLQSPSAQSSPAPAAASAETGNVQGVDSNVRPLTDAEAIEQINNDGALAVTAQATPPATRPQATAPAAPVEGAIVVRAGKHPGFERLVFDWPETVDYQLDRQGDRLTVRFDQPGEPDLRAVAFMELQLATSVVSTGTANAMALSMSIPADAEIRDFRLDTKVVVDIVGQPSNTQPVVRQSVQVPAPAAAPSPTAPVPDQRPAVTAGTSAQTAVATPSAPITQQAGTPLVNNEPAEPAETPEAQELVLPRAPDQESVDLTVVEGEASDENQIAAQTTSIRIDPNVPTAAAIFARADALWIAFSLPDLDVTPLIEGPAASQVRRADVFRLENGMAYRFPLPPGLYPRAELDGRVWEVNLSPIVTPTPTARIEIEGSEVSAGKRLSIGMDVSGVVMELEDPLIGDRLFLVPANKAGVAVREARRLPELEFIPAVQGAVIRPLIDDLEVTAGTETVKVQAPEGLLLSASRSDLLGAATQGAPTVDGLKLFDLEEWQRGPMAAFEGNRIQLQQDISEIPLSERAPYYLDLARLYFAHGFGAEATGLIRLAVEIMPELGEQPEVRALRGAAMALRGDGAEALADLEIEALNIHPEAALWRGVALTRLGRWAQAGQQFLQSGDLILSYPNGLYREIAGLMAEALLVVDEVDVAEAIVNELSRRSAEISVNQAAINYLRGDIALRQGLLEDGQSLWKQVADEGKDQLYRVKARLGLIESELAAGAITKEEAIPSLEQLRFAWRGDTLELAILRRLGVLYLDTGDYFGGFELLRRAAGYFPGSTQSQALTADLAQAFRRLYVDGEADQMSPIEAYGLFDEFRELNPLGDTGDKVIQRLAERLISVDLLGEAAELLQQQVEFRALGLEKSRLGARLAGVRLLDDLPELALEALELSVVDEPLPIELSSERTLLEGRAYQQMGEPDQALAVISGLDSEAATRLRADIGWRFGRWDVAGRALTNLLEPPPPEGVALPQRQIQLVMNAAIALSLAGEQPALNRLRDTYGPAMNLTPVADSFRLVTRPLSGSLLADFQTLQQQMQEVDLFGGFLEGYRQIQNDAAIETGEPQTAQLPN